MRLLLLGKGALWRCVSSGPLAAEMDDQQQRRSRLLLLADRSLRERWRWAATRPFGAGSNVLRRAGAGGPVVLLVRSGGDGKGVGPAFAW